MDEVVDIVDEQGNILRTGLKTDAHKHGWLHITVIGCVRQNGGWPLVRQSFHKQDAGQYVFPVGGHVQSGESELEALKREAYEEAGIRTFTHRHLGRRRYHRKIIGRDENHIFSVYEIETDDPLDLGPESDNVKFFAPDRFTERFRTSPHIFGDAHVFVVEHFYPSFLPLEYSRRWANK